jgi:predicted metal-binding protein
MIYVVRPVIDSKMIALCKRSYPSHPKGCPNFGKKKGCPPKVPMFDNVFDTSSVFAIVNTFPIGQHIEKMRASHPNWSDRQLRCCLYWQGTARKQLKKDIKDFQNSNSEYVVSTCPEAMGVNLTATMKDIGIEIEWPPQKLAYQIALAAIPIRSKR